MTVIGEHQPLTIGRVRNEPGVYYVGIYSEFAGSDGRMKASFRGAIKLLPRFTADGKAETIPFVDPFFNDLVFDQSDVAQIREIPQTESDLQEMYRLIWERVMAQRSGIELPRPQLLRK